MVRFVFPYHKDFYLDFTEAKEWLLVNGLGCPSPDKDDVVEVLGFVVKTKTGIKDVNFVNGEIHS